ncbi:hypothetical protein LguiB_019123 [Lonicera macranthoides]
MERNQELTDQYNGTKFKWIWVCQKVNSSTEFYNPRDLNSTLRSEDREDLHHIHKLWVCMDLSEFGPPGDFDMVAMDLEVKEMVMKDLERFVMKGEHYRKVRKAWKRGYLLDEPLGIEDIDYIIELHDGLVSASLKNNQEHHHEEENKVYSHPPTHPPTNKFIIVLTLLWPGRMDLRIHMSYCTPCGFKLLAANYLNLKRHELFGEIEELIRTMEVTPAEGAEQMLKNDDPDVTLSGLIDFLHTNKKEIEEAKIKESTTRSKMAMAKATLYAVGSIAAAAMVAHAVVQDTYPKISKNT